MQSKVIQIFSSALEVCIFTNIRMPPLTRKILATWPACKIHLHCAKCLPAAICNKYLCLVTQHSTECWVLCHKCRELTCNRATFASVSCRGLVTFQKLKWSVDSIRKTTLHDDAVKLLNTLSGMIRYCRRFCTLTTLVTHFYQRGRRNYNEFPKLNFCPCFLNDEWTKWLDWGKQ